MHKYDPSIGEAFATNPQRDTIAASVLLKRVEELERAENQLGEIRGMLFVNFCTERQHAGVRIVEKKTVLATLLDVLTAYDEKIAVLEQRMSGHNQDKPNTH